MLYVVGLVMDCVAGHYRLWVGGIILFIGVFFSFNPMFAGEFNKLLDEAVERGTRIDAARSRREAAESSVKRAWSRFLPSVSASGEYGYNRDNALNRLNRVGREQYDSSAYGVSAQLPIYRGGANYYGLKEAKANATAEAHAFYEAKQILLLDTSRAILGVLRDRKIVNLQRENRGIVASILRSTELRFRGGEATKTDISISRDELTLAQSIYTQALDNLHQNETEFARIIGRAPGRLSYPRRLKQLLPETLDSAIALAEDQNPQLLAAIFRSQAADHSLRASYSRFLPSVDLNMDYLEERNHGTNLPDESEFAVKLNFSVPLFQPEALPARDESLHVAEQRKFEARDARYTARAMATVAWNSYHNARKRYQLSLARIKAASSAADGMLRELDAGQRTVLDMLDIQERLVQAKVQAANSKFESYMAAYLLLSATGQLDIETLGTDEYSTYIHSAQKKQFNKKNDAHKWRAQRASLKQSDIKQKRLSGTKRKSPRARVQGSDKSWKIQSFANGTSFLKRVARKRVALPVLKSQLRAPVGAVAARDIKLKAGDVATQWPVSLHKNTKVMVQTKADEGIVTGSVDRFPDRSGVRAKIGKSSSWVKKVKIHKIPLPEKKLTGATTKIVSQGHGKVEEYPASLNNKFAVWWNNGVDSIIGPAKGPKTVLVPVDEYRQKYFQK